MKRSLTGIRPSGNVHLGNYLGTIRPALSFQKDYQCLYFIADMHSLTTTKDAGALRKAVYDVVATWIAMGLDTKRHIMYRQSDVPMVAEYAWYLGCCTGMGFLEKAHAYKDSLAQGKDVNHGVLAYPLLMAADIVMYDADIVPVGKDQKQHVEMARDVAGSFNALYGKEVIKMPEVYIDEKVMLIPGLDGRKMSKSYGNEIALFSDEKTLRSQIMSIKTDSTGLAEPKQLKGSLIAELYSHFASAEQYRDLESRLAKGGMGWGHAKEELFQVIDAHIKDFRDRYFELRNNESYLSSVLREGAKQAFNISLPVLNRVRRAVGMEDLPLVFS